MHPDPLRRPGVRRIGIVQDQREALGTLRHTAERKWWRGIVAFARIFRRDLTAWLKSFRRERESHGSASRIGNEPRLEDEKTSSKSDNASRTQPDHGPSLPPPGEPARMSIGRC